MLIVYPLKEEELGHIEYQVTRIILKKEGYFTSHPSFSKIK